MSREMVNSGIPWIGEIPKSWRIIRNKNVFSNSKTLVGDAWNTTQLLSLTTKGIKAVAIGSTSGKVPDSYDTYQVVEKDNIVMCLFDLDCSAVFSGLSPIRGMISPAYKALTVKNGFLPDFYAKWFDYIFDGRKFMFLSKNIRYSLTYDEFASLQVVAPSLSEQQKIASFLDRKCAEIDEMIALQEKIVEELKAYKHSVIIEAVTKGLNPDAPMKDSGIEWIGEIPESWRITTIGRLFRISAGGDAKWDIYSEKQDEEHPYPVYTNTLDKNQSYAYTSTPIFNGDTITVTGRGDIGRAFYRETPFDAIIRLLVLEKRYMLDCRYFAYFINDAIHFFTNSAAIGQLSAVQVAPYNICHPSLEEQTKIADYLDKKCIEIESLISIKLSKIDSLKEYKKSIIYEYVTGKKEITE